MRLADFIEANSSRIMGVGMSIDRKLCDLCEELADEVELLKAALPESGISLHCEGAVQGRFDASRIREAVHNLVANAIKYGDPGSAVQVSIEGKPQQVTLAVANRGPAIPAGAEAAIFDPLRRGAAVATTGENSSLGLGLFVVREVVLAHGGAIEARPEDGVTTFIMSLPREP